MLRNGLPSCMACAFRAAEHNDVRCAVSPSATTDDLYLHGCPGVSSTTPGRRGRSPYDVEHSHDRPRPVLLSPPRMGSTKAGFGLYEVRGL